MNRDSDEAQKWTPIMFNVSLREMIQTKKKRDYLSQVVHNLTNNSCTDSSVVSRHKPQPA